MTSQVKSSKITGILTQAMSKKATCPASMARFRFLDLHTWVEFFISLVCSGGLFCSTPFIVMVIDYSCYFYYCYY